MSLPRNLSIHRLSVKPKLVKRRRVIPPEPPASTANLGLDEFGQPSPTGQFPNSWKPFLERIHAKTDVNSTPMCILVCSEHKLPLEEKGGGWYKMILGDVFDSRLASAFAIKINTSIFLQLGLEQQVLLKNKSARVSWVDDEFTLCSMESEKTKIDPCPWVLQTLGNWVDFFNVKDEENFIGILLPSGIENGNESGNENQGKSGIEIQGKSGIEIQGKSGIEIQGKSGIEIQGKSGIEIQSESGNESKIESQPESGNENQSENQVENQFESKPTSQSENQTTFIELLKNLLYILFNSRAYQIDFKNGIITFTGVDDDRMIKTKSYSLTTMDLSWKFSKMSKIYTAEELASIPPKIIDESNIWLDKEKGSIFKVTPLDNLPFTLSQEQCALQIFKFSGSECLIINAMAGAGKTGLAQRIPKFGPMIYTSTTKSTVEAFRPQLTNFPNQAKTVAALLMKLTGMSFMEYKEANSQLAQNFEEFGHGEDVLPPEFENLTKQLKIFEQGLPNVIHLQREGITKDFKLGAPLATLTPSENVTFNNLVTLYNFYSNGRLNYNAWKMTATYYEFVCSAKYAALRNWWSSFCTRTGRQFWDFSANSNVFLDSFPVQFLFVDEFTLVSPGELILLKLFAFFNTPCGIIKVIFAGGLDQCRNINSTEKNLYSLLNVADRYLTLNKHLRTADDVLIKLFTTFERGEAISNSTFTSLEPTKEKIWHENNLFAEIIEYERLREKSFSFLFVANKDAALHALALGNLFDAYFSRRKVTFKIDGVVKTIDYAFDDNLFALLPLIVEQKYFTLVDVGPIPKGSCVILKQIGSDNLGIEFGNKRQQLSKRNYRSHQTSCRWRESSYFFSVLKQMGYQQRDVSFKSFSFYGFPMTPAFSTNIYKSQGSTFDHYVFVNLAKTTREQGYVALTRQKHFNQLCILNNLK